MEREQERERAEEDRAVRARERKAVESSGLVAQCQRSLAYVT
jgi:hypothetical protein